MATLQVVTGKKILSLGILLLACGMAPGENRQMVLAQQVFTAQTPTQATALEGSWQLSSSTGKLANAISGNTAVRIMADGFFSVAVYNKEKKSFLGTYGGTYVLENGRITEKLEFNTFDSTKVGAVTTATYSLRNGKWLIKVREEKLKLQKHGKRQKQAKFLLR